MPLWKNTQHAFTSGFLDRDVMGRQDLDKYFKGATRLTNFVVRRQGCISKRRGTDLVADLSWLPVGCKLRLVGVNNGDDGRYVVLSGGRCYTASRDGIITTSGTHVRGISGDTTAHSIPIPYADADLHDICVRQSGDTIFLAHRDYPPAKIVFGADGFPKYEVMRFDNTDWRPPVIDDVVMRGQKSVQTDIPREIEGDASFISKCRLAGTIVSAGVSSTGSDGSDGSNSYATTFSVTTERDDEEIGAKVTTVFSKSKTSGKSFTVTETSSSSGLCSSRSPVTTGGTAESSAATSSPITHRVVRYRVTYVKDGRESRPSRAMSVEYDMPWKNSAVVDLMFSKGDNEMEPDYYNVYKDNGSGYGLIGNSRDRYAVGDVGGYLDDDGKITDTGSNRLVNVSSYAEARGCTVVDVMRRVLSRSNERFSAYTSGDVAICCDKSTIRFGCGESFNKVVVALDGRIHDHGLGCSSAVLSRRYAKCTLKTSGGSSLSCSAFTLESPLKNGEAVKFDGVDAYAVGPGPQTDAFNGSLRTLTFDFSEMWKLDDNKSGTVSLKNGKWTLTRNGRDYASDSDAEGANSVVFDVPYTSNDSLTAVRDATAWNISGVCNGGTMTLSGNDWYLTTAGKTYGSQSVVTSRDVVDATLCRYYVDYELKAHRSNSSSPWTYTDEAKNSVDLDDPTMEYNPSTRRWTLKVTRRTVGEGGEELTSTVQYTSKGTGSSTSTTMKFDFEGEVTASRTVGAWTVKDTSGDVLPDATVGWIGRWIVTHGGTTITAAGVPDACATEIYFAATEGRRKNVTATRTGFLSGDQSILGREKVVEMTIEFSGNGGSAIGCYHSVSLYDVATSASGVMFQDDYINPDMTVTPPDDTRPMHFSGVGDYPGCVGVYGQRLVFASTRNDPSTVWFSRIGDLYDFTPHSSIREDDALEVTIAATEFPDINSIVMGRDLILFADGGEWQIAPVSGNALTYKTVSAKLQSMIGSSRSLMPIMVGDEILFAERGGQCLRTTNYNYSSDSYQTADLSVLAQSLFRANPIVSMAYKQHPDSTVECVLQDGRVATLVYMREQELVAWCVQEFGGGWKAVEVATPKCIVDGTTEMMFLVERDGAFQLWKYRNDTDEATRSAQVVLDGLHMEDSASAAGAGEVAVSLGDGRYACGFTVQSDFVTVRPEPKSGATAQFDIKDATECEVRVVNGSSFRVKPYSVADGIASNLGHDAWMNVSVPVVFEGEKVALGELDARRLLSGSNNRDGRIHVRHDEAWPLTILNVSCTYQIEYANSEGGRNGGDE